MKRIITTEAGTTLIELMVVLAIIIITASFAFSGQLINLPQKRTKNAVFALARDVWYARSQAVDDNTHFFLCKTGSGQYEIARVDDPETATGCGDPDTTTTQKTVDLTDRFTGVVFGYKSSIGVSCAFGWGSIPSSFDFTQSRATFNSLGASVDGTSNASPESGTLFIKNTKDPDEITYCIRVGSSNGRPKVFKWDESQGWIG